MTKKQLEQMFYIVTEIKMWQERLNKISLVKSPKITDMPKGTSKADIADIVISKEECKENINKFLIKAQKQRILIDNFIENIEDSFIRQIIYLRNACLMEWEEVARSIGGGNSGEAIRNKYNRFLKKMEIK